jgi:hypothetical protein
MKRNTLIDDINLFRAKDLSAHDMINPIEKQSDFYVNIELKKLRFLFYNSSKLRYIIHQIHIYVLSHTLIDKTRKLLITKTVSLKAYF